MPNEPAKPQQVYGFAVGRPLLWPTNFKPAVPAPSDAAAESQNKAAAEIAEAGKEIAAINPRVGQEILRLLTEPESTTPANTASKAVPSAPSIPKPANAVPSARPATPTSPTTVVAAAISPATVAAASSPTTVAAAHSAGVESTAASAIIDLTSPPANPRRHTSRNSPASKKSVPRAAKSHPRRTAKPAQRLAPPQRPRLLTGLELHQAHCGICNSDLHDEIDERFLNWEHVGTLAEEYKTSRSIIYRHANATGLFVKRDRNCRRALGHIIHNAAYAFTTGDTVIRAVKTLAHLNARGEWVNPPTHVVFSTKTTPAKPSAARPAAKLSGTPSRVIRRAKH